MAIIAGKQTRLEKTQDAMNSAPVIDINVNINIPKVQTLKEDKKYKCTCCGDSWNTQKNHFSMSKSVLFQSNNGYINVCNTCRDKYYYQLIDLYSGSEEKAIEHMCRQFGWIYHVDALEASRQVSQDRSRISHYLAKKNLGQTAMIGSTDIDTVKHVYSKRKENVIESKEHLEQLKSNGMVDSSASSIDRWGAGLSDWDYSTLDDHYKMLKKNNPNCDNNQEIFIKALCNLNWLMIKSLRTGDGDSDKYIKLTEQYSKTFKQAGLKTIQETDNSGEETLGVTLATISQYTPEEYYKNKELYKDFDKLGEYFERFVKRPLKNLMTGSKDRDVEFCVKEDTDTGEIDGDLDE